MAARKLARRAERDKRGAFLIEGPTAVMDALSCGAEVQEVFIDKDFQDEALTQLVESSGIELYSVGRDVIQVLSDTVTPQGVVGVVSDPSADVEVLRGSNLVLVLADVRDPGNAGTLVRSAAAAGADAVVFASGSVDPLHPKVARSAAGALFQVSLVRGVPLAEAVAVLNEQSTTVVGTAATAEVDMYETDLRGPIALVLGNEAWGLPPEAAALTDVVVRIPMPGPVESLNVSTAGSILLFEALRQRLAEPK
jgi:RNA methyltransferase, TrmH family